MHVKIYASRRTPDRTRSHLSVSDVPASPLIGRLRTADFQINLGPLFFLHNPLGSIEARAKDFGWL